ncbi:hypothetical protein AVEN_145364-1 [Araneus ventricosus]|uniref:Uncharacterized protein n=1 Tax=Araneus ventricosus TaxID=182803 RepID=A0A4Y2QLS4_ARAVE|nr:hypothetical protein AVEN_145364-1 [Araneus ventricosus]
MTVFLITFFLRCDFHLSTCAICIILYHKIGDPNKKMAQQPEDKKPDFSNFPRGAIGIKGLPVVRNARLPSIRTPRDLTLGSQPKRTFTPNIPVRREKKPTE